MPDHMKQGFGIPTARLSFILVVAGICFLLGIAYQGMWVFFHRHPQQQMRKVEAMSNPSDSKLQTISSEELRRLLDTQTAYESVSMELKQMKNIIAKLPNTNQQHPSEDKRTGVEDKNAIEKENVSGAAAISWDYDSPYGSGGEARVPSIVRAWREAKLDWHSLLPKHNSIWERFGNPEGGGKLRALVAKEVQVTDFLTRFHESGLSAKYGHDYGVLQAYSGCDAFINGCTIHNEDDCKKNQLCAWDEATKFCNEIDPTSATWAPTPEHSQTCENPHLVSGKSIIPSRNPSTDCKAYIHQPAVLVHIDSESQAMFYHWWASWSSIIDYWKKTLNANRLVHFFLGDINDPMFFHYFGLISNHCWRRSFNQVPPGTCFCNTYDLNAAQSRSDPEGAAKAMIKYLGLENESPPANRVRIGIISRRRKRFILNEYQLVDEARKMGYECSLLPLETMTLHEQMKALRSLDVLIGIHGSALDNSVFLHRGSVMVQLLPFSVEHRVTFQSSAETAGIIYQEWQLKDKSNAYFHWDLLAMANTEKLNSWSKESILSAGQRVADNRETTMFWINQDIIVPLDEWRSILVKAVTASPAKTVRGLDVTPKS